MAVISNDDIVHNALHGDPGLADAQCQLLIANKSSSPTPWIVSALIALRVGVPDKAMEWVDHARRYGGDVQTLMDIEREISRARISILRQPQPSRPRYHLITCWGYGFWADVEHVLGHLLLCEITGRFPIIHWGANSWYSDDLHNDGFTRFFDPISPLGIDDLPPHAGSIFPDKWVGQNLRRVIFNRYSGPGSRVPMISYLVRQELVTVADFFAQVATLVRWLPQAHPMYGKSVEDVYAYLMARYIHPRPEITDQVESFVGKHFSGRHVLGAHIRNNDKFQELGGHDPTQKINQLVKEYMDTHPDSFLFLMTDNSHALAHYQERYGERLIFTNCLRSHNGKPVTWIATKPREELGLEIMLDTYIGARCDAFIGLGLSSVVAAIGNLADPSRTKITLVGPKLQTFINVQPYIMEDPTRTSEKADTQAPHELEPAE